MINTTFWLCKNNWRLLCKGINKNNTEAMRNQMSHSVISFPCPLRYSIDLHPWHHLMEARVQPRQTEQLWHHSRCPDGTTGWKNLTPSFTLAFSSCVVFPSFCPHFYLLMFRRHRFIVATNRELHVREVCLFLTFFLLSLLEDRVNEQSSSCCTLSFPIGACVSVSQCCHGSYRAHYI